MKLNSNILQKFYQILFSLLIAFLAIRIFEHVSIADKSFVEHPIQYQLLGWLYDVWCIFIYSLIVLPFFILLSFIHEKVAILFFHVLNILLLIGYLCLMIVFSERNNPFDHEFFTRAAADSWETVKQMATTGFKVFLPFIIYLALYLVGYFFIFKKKVFGRRMIVIALSLTFLCSIFFKFSNPNSTSFKRMGAYYLTVNKLSYWVADCFKYFQQKDKFNANKLSKEELDAAIKFYQQNHPFEFTNTEYPLLHKNTPDVLGSFFNLDSVHPPNIVILVVEGLSRDFSGENAYATSFTPFLDSLSKHSLTWNNFLSTAPATFAAHPAIEGSLPYGNKGFSVLNVMPNHLSLIKILRANGYHSKFLIGFNPDFDNMGGFIRLQGTDMILTKYGAKYKEMGIGEEGWSMGYPDDALFSRSFEVMDSLKQTPYLNIYHTGTTHMPYLFEQKPLYEKLFDKKLKTINASKQIKKTLKECKGVITTFMFSDDCLRDFFAKYSKREDFKNTIFFITGDHHIGSFPSTGSIDDYHVPFIVYSPMLKQAKQFYSINAHNNIAPTITSLILNNYKQLTYQPQEVHWLADVIDTTTHFSNKQSMAFMAWSREMNDYIWKDYMLSNGALYKLSPNLMMDNYENDSIKKHLTNLLNNYKIINSYVCSNDKIFPAEQLKAIGERKLLFEFNKEQLQTITTNNADTTLMENFKIPNGYKYLYVEVSADANLLNKGLDNQPSFRFALIDTTNDNYDYVFYTNHDLVQIAKNEFVEKQWNALSTNDMVTLNDYSSYKNLMFELALYAQKPINVQVKNLKLKLWGVK